MATRRKWPSCSASAANGNAKDNGDGGRRPGAEADRLAAYNAAPITSAAVYSALVPFLGGTNKMITARKEHAHQIFRLVFHKTFLLHWVFSPAIYSRFSATTHMVVVLNFAPFFHSV